jgi:ABC-2 type transport system permease protein
MLFNLVKKDFILTKKYLLLMVIAVIGESIFLQSKIYSVNDGGFLTFFLITFITLVILFNQVAMSEDKYKGAALLCATPYTRNALVKAKYLLLLVIFICCYIIYTATAYLAPIHMKMPSISVIGISLLITTIFFGIYLPVLYQFGYEKTKFAWNIIFILPCFALPLLGKYFISSGIRFQSIPSFPPTIQALFPGFLALVIGYISMIVSTHIYSKKDL